MNKYIIALGMFDGVHLGHQNLLRQVSDISKRRGDISTVFTYLNHPREILYGQFEYLTDPDQRFGLYRSMGIQKIDAILFTENFAALTPEDFLHWLFERYENRIGTIICGYDYRFGKNASGRIELLKEICGKLGTEVVIIPPVMFGNEPCSSTRVRDALKAGLLDTANEMLQRPYSIKGPVIHNKANGRKMGFPTANILISRQVLPKDGVYATAFLLNNKAYPAVTNIGTNPTLGENERTIETHIPDVNMDIYGENAEVFFLKYIREERIFPSVENLILQIASDTENAKKVYKEKEKSVYKFINLW